MKKRVIRLTESQLTGIVKKAIKEMMGDDLSDKVEPYSKFKSSNELLKSIRDRLSTAVQMQEWSMVEEVTMDVYNFIKNNMEQDDFKEDIPGFEGTMDKLDDLGIR